MSDRDDAAEQETPGAENISSGNGTLSVALPRVIEALRQEGAPVDVNFLLIQMAQKTQSPHEVVESSRQMLAITREFEQQRVENFKNMADAVIDVKMRDPDEVEKRRNNMMRRCLKGLVGSCAVVGLGGGIVGATLGANIVVAALLIAAGGLALALSGPLAAGESISSNDVVRIVSALRRIRSSTDDDEEPDQRPKGRQKR